MLSAHRMTDWLNTISTLYSRSGSPIVYFHFISISTPCSFVRFGRIEASRFSVDVDCREISHLQPFLCATPSQSCGEICNAKRFVWHLMSMLCGWCYQLTGLLLLGDGHCDADNRHNITNITHSIQSSTCTLLDLRKTTSVHTRRTRIVLLYAHCNWFVASKSYVSVCNVSSAMRVTYLYFINWYWMSKPNRTIHDTHFHWVNGKAERNI